MKIYTKKGDNGTTGLIGGMRVQKSDIRIEAYGTVDELNSFLGLVKDSFDVPHYQTQILEIQNDLFVIGSKLATSPEGTKMDLPKIHPQDISKLEVWMDQMDTELPQLTHFLLPGGHVTNSHCHVARCVCRRAERKVVALDEMTENHLEVQYLNRLSDYLFMLSRIISKTLKIEEVKWIPKK
jgi:cob(I)alamin adenosyltransferase